MEEAGAAEEDGLHRGQQSADEPGSAPRSTLRPFHDSSDDGESAERQLDQLPGSVRTHPLQPPVTRRRSRGSRSLTLRPGLQAALDAITTGPAFVRNGRMDILATNLLGRAFHAETFAAPGEGNIARYTFLDPRAQSFYPNWETAADIVVAILRTEAGRDPFNKAIQDLVGELSTRSDEFRIRWSKHNVRWHGAGTKSFHHPVVGDLTFAYEDMQFIQHHGLTFLIYVPEPGSPSEERTRLLASWQATTDTSTSVDPARSSR